MLKWHIGALICPFSYYFMTDFIITDKLDNRQVELTFEQYYDLKLGLKCAAKVYLLDHGLWEIAQGIFCLK